MQKLIHKTKLNNGLTIIYVPFQNIRSVHLTLQGSAGGFQESTNEIGVAHFLEHMLFEGSRKYPSAEKLGALIDDVGGHRNATTFGTKTSYSVRILNTYIENAFEYIHELAFNPLFTKDAIIKQKRIILEEARREKDNPDYYLFKKIMRTLYPPEQRRAYPLIGRERDIMKINERTLHKFWEDKYTGQNFALGICGDLNFIKIQKLANKYLISPKKGKKLIVPKPKKPLSTKIITSNRKNAKQVKIFINFRAPKNHIPDAYAAISLRNILGLGPDSRLFKEIRTDMGLAYSVGATYESNIYDGVFEIYVYAAEENVERVLKVIRFEIEKICKDLVEEKEFKKNKYRILTDVAHRYETPRERLEFFVDNHLFNREKETFESRLKKFELVTQEDIRKVAKDIFSEEICVAISSKSVRRGQIKKWWHKNE